MTGISPVYHSSDAQKYGCFSATTVIFGVEGRKSAYDAEKTADFSVTIIEK